MKGLFVKNCSPTREGWYIVRYNGNAKQFWGLYVPKTAENPEHWLLAVPAYFTYHCLIYKKFNDVEWMPSSYADPYDCPLGGVYLNGAYSSGAYV